LVSPVIKNVRMRITTAEVNAGHTLLAAVADKGYRMISCKAIAIGGTAATVTTVDVMGDSGGAQVLVAYAVAGLVQSAVLTDGDANSAVLADGVSYIANTDNTAISVIKNGGDMITATHIDIIMSYVLE